MSRYPPPPPNQFQRPPPPPGGGFGPPPGGGPRPGMGFAPPPPPNTFAPPPPPQQQQQQQQGGGGGGFAPPPPPANTPGMNQLNQSMAGMSFQQPGPPPPGPPMASRPPPGPFGQPGPPPPGPPQPGPPQQGGSFQPPPPSPSPAVFQPPPPGPPGPPSMQPPPPGPQGGAGFYQQQGSAQGQMGRGAAPVGPPSTTPGVPAPTMQQANIDFSVKIPKKICQFTTGKVPQTAGAASAAKLPLGGVLRPLAPVGNDDDEIDLVQPGSAGIIRCKRCRTYINAFVTWTEHGRRWICNICSFLNDTPAAYFCHLDDQGLRRDRLERPELSKGAIEFIAPAEYMVRPPQEPSYFFVIDVSATAVRSGMLHHAASAIKESLDNLPGKGRTKIGFITFDNSVHYYNLSSDLSNPQMLVVSDLKELFVPLPDNLLVNLRESRSVVDTLLDNLPDMFAKRPVNGQSCLGPALKAAFTVMKQIGGKMCVFQTILPNLGDGSLKPRENPGLMGTPNEIKLLRPDIPWYKDTAVEFSRQQISVDMFLFPYQYLDFASLGELAKFTSGSLHSYAFFNPEKDGRRFEEQLEKVLTTPTAFEAVMRIRCTKGMRITNFYGNFYIRGTDLMALPNVNSDSVFGFDLAHDEQNVASSYVTVQAALLYTSSDGQRRIRVMTQALPVTTLTSDLVSSINVDATCNLLSKQAVDVSLKTSLDNARMRLQQSCVDIIRAAKGGDKRTVSGYTVPQGPQPGEHDDKPIPENLQLLPLYALAMMKNVAFRGGTDVHPDERVQAHHQINRMWLTSSKHYIYPRMFVLHSMDGGVGYPLEDGTDEDPSRWSGRNRILLPEVASLSVNYLSSEGIYLLDNTVDMLIWVGRSADANMVNSLFGMPSLENCDPNTIKFQPEGDFGSRVSAIVEALREDEDDPFVVSSRVQVVREGDGHMEARFFWFMVEDRASFQGGTYSYEEFMQFVQNPGTGAGQPPPPGQPGPARGAPPGPPRGQAPMPPPQQHQQPPPPRQQGYAARGPPASPYGAPPPPSYQSQPPPPMSSNGPPPPPGPPVGGYGAPPPPQNRGMPPPPGPPTGGPSPRGAYGAPPPPPPNRGMPPPPGPPPPPGRGMPPPPPPPAQYRR